MALFDVTLGSCKKQEVATTIVSVKPYAATPIHTPFSKFPLESLVKLTQVTKRRSASKRRAETTLAESEQSPHQSQSR